MSSLSPACEGREVPGKVKVHAPGYVTLRKPHSSARISMTTATGLPIRSLKASGESSSSFGREPHSAGPCLLISLHLLKWSGAGGMFRVRESMKVSLSRTAGT